MFEKNGREKENEQNKQKIKKSTAQSKIIIISSKFSMNLTVDK